MKSNISVTDIIIERWISYGPQARRRTIVQRAATVRPYPAPRNIIIQYETAPVRIVHQFHRLGVVQANSAVYIQTYSATLLDAASLVAQARAAGIVENISPSGYVSYSATGYSQESFGASSGFAGGAGLIAGGAGLVTGGAEVVDAGLALGGRLSSSSFESSSFSSGVDGGANAAFLVADTNLIDTLDQGELHQFLEGYVPLRAQTTLTTTSLWQQHSIVPTSALLIQPLTLINNFDKYWCTTTYYEPDIQVGETFKIHDTYKEVTIDGGTDMAISTITLKKNDKCDTFTDCSNYTTSTKAIPSAIHTALVELVRRNLLHFVVSSHTNGLHLRSTMLTKIHENSNLETCQKCHEKYLLDFLMRTATAVHDHTTNRKYFQHSMSQL
ncbi:unnamed protein product [Rotaria sordida]|uniref:MH2 domain-containing protein n=2 Tax=Rotaria sordida TaxID=392033 RepID=A0A814BJE1_9BILA|nr:unnamed protein product [Rotaria sordida]